LIEFASGAQTAQFSQAARAVLAAANTRLIVNPATSTIKARQGMKQLVLVVVVIVSCLMALTGEDRDQKQPERCQACAT
jgi:hypothetical protein